MMEFEEEIFEEFKTPLQTVKKRRYHDTPSVLTTDPSALEDLLGCISSDIPESPLTSKPAYIAHDLLEQDAQRDYTLQGMSPLGQVKARDSRGNVFYFSKRNIPTDSAASSRNNTMKGRLIQENVHILLNTFEGDKLNEKVQEIQHKQHRSEDGELWVDKYRPKKYIDLSGSQEVNKAVLDWVKGWDYCVFKKKRRDKKSNDPLQRPQNKILLLTGPPGLGKTTLAHVIANHAGYNVIEVNASDDRTGEALKNKLAGAIEVKESMMNNKPNLVIIDEIDGASMSGSGDQNFMKFLLDKVQENDTEKKSKILRPIICICNDQYAPVLRPLRAVAEIYVIKPPIPHDLAKRLQDICLRENLKADLRSILLLVDLVEGDMRSAINTLQFMKTKTNSITPELVRSSCIGVKDMQKGLFPIWNAIFEIPSGKESKKRPFQVFNESNVAVGEMMLLIIDNVDMIHSSRILSMIQSNGEYEKILQGIFEHYLLCKITDIGATGTIKSKLDQVSDWLNFYIKLDHSVNANQQYECMGYMAYTFLKCHYLFGSPNRRFRIEYPRASYQNFLAFKSNQGIIKSFWQGFSPLSKKSWNSANVACELIPYLAVIISPDLKSMNIQVLKSDEQVKLNSTVKSLAAFGIKLVQQKETNGSYCYRLEPPIELLLEKFQVSSKRRRSIHNLPYPILQFISQELSREYLRRAEASKSANIKKPNSVIHTPAKTPKKFLSPMSAIKALSPAITESILAQDSKEKVKRDFFGREVEPETKTQTMIVNAPTTYSVLYKYHEGSSSAVRKPVVLSDLL